MRSSKDIEPRVGMQVLFELDDRSKRISKVDRDNIYFDNDTHAQSRGTWGAWDFGNYEIEWTPPTDEERRLFMEAADNQRRIHLRHLCSAVCVWVCEHAFGNPDERATVLDSLALDGADYDNMPPGCKWHPPERSKR